MILILIIAIWILPELLKSSQTEQQSRKIRARQEEKARELAERQAAQIRKQAERNRQIELKRSQAAAQLEQLACIRDQYLELAADLEEQISLCWQPAKKIKLLDRQLKMEQRLYDIDSRIAKLWDAAYSH